MRTKHIFFASLCVLVGALAIMSCSEDRVTSNYDTHPTNWMDPYSEEWHGAAALPSQGESCLGCHSLDAVAFPDDNGPVAEQPAEGLIACTQCHNYPHGTDYVPQHNLDVRASGWTNMGECQACHGVDFAGGRTGASCNGCHTLDGGPAACNTCHGYPPTTTRPLGERNPGAHSAHSQYACTECHNIVVGLDHIDALPADVAFSAARISTANGFPASYSPSNCATWCHSNLNNEPGIVTVQWNSGQTLTQCRSCHQVPPTNPLHPTEQRCHFCHLNVDPNSNYNDANEIRFLPGDTLHVNGVVNAIFP